MLVINWMYTGTLMVDTDRLSNITRLASTLGIANLIQTVAKLASMDNISEETQSESNQDLKVKNFTKNRESASPTYFELRKDQFAQSRSPSPLHRDESPRKRSTTQPLENINKKVKQESLPLLQNILTQFPLNPSFIQTFASNLANKEKESWVNNFATDLGHLGPDIKQLEVLGKLHSNVNDAAAEKDSFDGSQSQLANILTAAAKLKQVAEQAIKSDDAKVEAGAGSNCRKLAFHEPRPCPVCRRMYRDAATLRTHTAIMHSEGTEPFRCSCGVAFGTKFEMYQHKKAGHPPVK